MSFSPRISLTQSSAIRTRIISQPRRAVNATRMASQAGQTISEVAKQEGDNSKGSTAAQMQSTLTKERNAATAEDQVGSKLAADPSSLTSEDAQYVQSRTSRATGGQQPPPGSVASQAQSVASANEDGTVLHAASNDSSNISPQSQSQLDREANYAEQADKVASKMQTDPSSIRKEDADKMHSREHRAFGATESGGLASQAQSQVAENEGAKK